MLIRTRSILAAALLFASPVTASDPPEIASFARPTTLDELLALPADRVDLARAALLVERGLARTDLDRATAVVDRIARQLAPRIAGLDPRRTLRRIAWTIYGGHRFSTRGVGASGRAHSFASTLQTRRGVCYGLSILIAAVGQRLRLPVSIVEIPGHVYVRYDDGEQRLNIETTRRGRIFGDDFYRKQYGLSKPAYERVLTSRQAVALFLVQTAGALYEIGREEAGRSALRRALDLDDGAPRAWYKLGIVRGAGGDAQAACDCFRRSLELRADDPTVWGAKGAALNDAGKADEAAAAFRSMLAIPAESAAVWRNCGRSLLIDGRFGPAARCFGRVLRQDEAQALEFRPLAAAVAAVGAEMSERPGERLEAAAVFYALGEPSLMRLALSANTDGAEGGADEVRRGVRALKRAASARGFVEVAEAILGVTSASAGRGSSAADRRR